LNGIEAKNMEVIKVKTSKLTVYQYLTLFLLIVSLVLIGYEIFWQKFSILMLIVISAYTLGYATSKKTTNRSVNK